MTKKKRKKKRKKQAVAQESNQTRISIIFLLLLVALGFIWWRITEYKYWRSYEKYPAQITRIYQIYSGNYNHMWRVEYQYTVDGEIYTDDKEFWHKADYGDRQVGDTIYIDVSSNKAEASRWKP